MTEFVDGSKLEWKPIDAHHLRASTDAGFDYDIIYTPDGQVSWQGMEFGEWHFEGSVDAAKAACQRERDALN